MLHINMPVIILNTVCCTPGCSGEAGKFLHQQVLLEGGSLGGRGWQSDWGEVQACRTVWLCSSHSTQQIHNKHKWNLPAVLKGFFLILESLETGGFLIFLSKLLAKKEAYEGTEIIAGLFFLRTQVGPLLFLYLLPVQSSHACVARKSPLYCCSAQGALTRNWWTILVRPPSRWSAKEWVYPTILWSKQRLMTPADYE